MSHTIARQKEIILTISRNEHGARHRQIVKPLASRLLKKNIFLPHGAAVAPICRTFAAAPWSLPCTFLIRLGICMNLNMYNLFFRSLLVIKNHVDLNDYLCICIMFAVSMRCPNRNIIITVEFEINIHTSKIDLYCTPSLST